MTGLSLCVITKNEEKNIGSCIEQFILRAKDRMDEIEILILDTGSTDDTVSIAEKLGASVYYFTWVNDFSKARNAAMEKAKYDMILFLDADEITEELDINKMLELVRIYPDAVGRFKRRNLCNAGNEKTTIMADLVERLFDRRLYHYEEPIHEQLTSNAGTNLVVYDIPLTVYHEGYMGTKEELKAKAERNNSLLEKCIENNPDEPYYYFQLGKSYGICGEFERQLENFKKAYELNPGIDASYRPFLIVGYGQCLIRSEDSSELFSFIEKECDYYSDYGDFLCMAGYAYMNNKDYEKAITYYERAMKSSYSHIEGSCSFIPAFNLGCIHEALGNEADAIKCFDAAAGHNDADSRKSNLLSKDINKKFITAILYIDDRVEEKLLGRLIEIISRQSLGMGHFEIIIVNSSKSAVLNEILSAFEKKYQESVGIINIETEIDKCDAFDIAVQYASSEVIAFLDEKCIPCWDYFRFFFECMKKSGADVVSDKIDYADGQDFILKINDEVTRENVRKAGILRTGYIGKVYSKDLITSHPECIRQLCSESMELDIASKIYCLGGIYEDITV